MTIAGNQQEQNMCKEEHASKETEVAEVRRRLKKEYRKALKSNFRNSSPCHECYEQLVGLVGMQQASEIICEVMEEVEVPFCQRLAGQKS